MRSFRAAGVSPIYSVSFPARVLQTEYAGIAQSVEQLIRNQQVVCSSHITSSTSEQASYRLLRLFSKVTARSLRCSSFPKRTRFAGLRFGHYGGLPDRALFSSAQRTPGTPADNTHPGKLRIACSDFFDKKGTESRSFRCLLSALCHKFRGAALPGSRHIRKLRISFRSSPRGGCPGRTGSGPADRCSDCCHCRSGCRRCRRWRTVSSRL